MTVKYYEDLVQGSDEWLKARLGIITASQTGKLITPTGKIANNDDSRGIVYEKVGERITKRTEDFFRSKYMDLGNVFEPFARDLYGKEKAPVREVGFIVRDFGHFKIGYSPDGLVEEDYLDDGEGLIEIKCPARNTHVKGICTGTTPAMYTMQMQAGMLVTGRKWCDYISHFNGMKQGITRIYADDKLQALIVEAVGKFEFRVLECMDLYEENTANMPMAKFIESEYHE